MTITRARIQCTIGRATCTAFGDPVTYDAQAGWRVGWPIGEGGVGVPPVTRYQYDGGWGYESGAWGLGRDGQGAVGGPLALWAENTDLPPVTLLHVGERWYDPALGRFLQRDPIGIGGGLNPYWYCDADPASEVDEEGLSTDPSRFRWQNLIKKIDKNIPRMFRYIRKNPTQSLFQRRVLGFLLRSRNDVYGRWLGPLGIIACVCDLSAAAARASEPGRRKLEEGMRGIRKRQGGFAPDDPIGPEGYEY